MGTYGSGTYGSGTYGGRGASAPSVQPGDGGLGHSWFAIEVTSEPVPEGPLLVGLLRRLPYAVGTVTVGVTRRLPSRVAPPVVDPHATIPVGITRSLRYAVQEQVVEPPVDVGQGQGSDTAGFFGPIVPERVEFRFRATVDGPQLEPLRAEFASAAHAVKTYERVIPGSASAVREVVFITPSRREPAYTWSLALQDDEDLLSLLCAI